MVNINNISMEKNSKKEKNSSEKDKKSKDKDKNRYNLKKAKKDKGDVKIEKNLKSKKSSIEEIKKLLDIHTEKEDDNDNEIISEELLDNKEDNHLIEKEYNYLTEEGKTLFISAYNEYELKNLVLKVKQAQKKISTKI